MLRRTYKYDTHNVIFLYTYILLHKTTKELSQIQIYTFLAYAFPWLIFVKKKILHSRLHPSAHLYTCVCEMMTIARARTSRAFVLYMHGATTTRRSYIDDYLMRALFHKSH